MGDALISNPLLHINNLSVFRDDTPILIDLSLTIKSGDWVVIRGRNGCGKSTLLKTIVGLVQPTTGGISISDYAYLGHSNGLRDSMTVGQHLKFMANWFKEPLQSTPVDHLKDLYIHQLSAGLKRQLALSQFILCHRPLWIMDEPLDNLDTQSRDFFLSIMQNHIKKGGAILQTSHELIPMSGVKEFFLDQMK
ncbi:MAG: heme ABC exporter ATP-binding protein CcmA [Candidatus Paracaedibacteraceae bacterium]|nr:heme ABC exporter ATP-binding protein CcmA [Candidatus Paracaedibacteraceae bacterium]